MTNVGILRSLCATLFSATVCIAIAPAQAQTYTVTHSFTGAPNDGAWANGELLQDAAGNLYGTTVRGGTDNIGTVFKLDTTGALTILHSFGTGNNDGGYPEGGLLQDTEGNLYGTTSVGGPGGGSGTVFKLDTSNTLKTLHSFGFNNDGAGPFSRLVTIDGDLYGITPSGGALPAAAGLFSR